MYKAINGLTLQDATTPDGWAIRSSGDIITALLSFPYFQTVAVGFIVEALQQAADSRKEYANIKDLAEYIAENYI